MCILHSDGAQPLADWYSVDDVFIENERHHEPPTQRLAQLEPVRGDRAPMTHVSQHVRPSCSDGPPAVPPVPGEDNDDDIICDLPIDEGIRGEAWASRDPWGNRCGQLRLIKRDGP